MTSDTPSYILDPAVPYGAIDDKNGMNLIDIVRTGIHFRTFWRFAHTIPFSFNEWSSFLHISERTLQRYQSEQKTFDPMQSEKILQIALLFKRGINVWGDAEKFHSWLDTDSIALGNIKPKSLLDSSIGIQMLNDELGRIEYGVLA